MERAEVLRLTEEETSTPKGLIGIGVFAAFAFLFMAFVSEPSFRSVPLVFGGLIVAMLAGAALWLRMQARFGQATLVAHTPFAFGTRFEGWIDSELPQPPAAPIRIKVSDATSGGYPVVVASQTVAPEQIAAAERGVIRIPFSLDIPDREAKATGGMRLLVRTQGWPLDWGATYLLRP